MLHDLDTTLAELLRRELPPDIVAQASISFATPDAQFPPASVQLPTINFFLYELQENRDLRSNELVMERQADGKVMRTLPPVRVDCHYLITAWANTGVQQPEQDEHRLLGEAMRVLLRHREIPVEALRGGLKSQTLPVRASVLQSSSQASRAEFWQALGGKPRATFNYTVTISVDPHGPEDAGRVAMVVEA